MQASISDATEQRCGPCTCRRRTRPDREVAPPDHLDHSNFTRGLVYETSTPLLGTRAFGTRLQPARRPGHDPPHLLSAGAQPALLPGGMPSSSRQLASWASGPAQRRRPWRAGTAPAQPSAPVHWTRLVTSAGGEKSCAHLPALPVRLGGREGERKGEGQ